MMRLPYAHLIEAYMRFQRMSVPDLVNLLNKRFRRDPDDRIQAQQIHDFLRGRTKPNAALAKAVERILKLDLDAEDYGFGLISSPFKQKGYGRKGKGRGK